LLVQPFSTLSITSDSDCSCSEPSQELSLHAQMEADYIEFTRQPTVFAKNQYLHQILDRNEPLFYLIVQQHLKEMLPILYTPTVGEVVRNFNEQPLRARGLYLSWLDRDRIAELLTPYSEASIKIAVLTDGERILGLGDQGVGGIEICMAKAMMYVICGQLAPHRLLPIYLDVGTNNPTLLGDPNYRGWRHPRLNDQDYEEFINKVVTELVTKFPGIYLHWEDFGRDNAKRILESYRNRYCTFNDDMQGTGVVTLAGALTAMKITGIPLTEQRIVIFGGGTAGLGIADQLCSAMERMGMMPAQARDRIWLIGRYGLLFSDSRHLVELQKPYARPAEERMNYHRQTDQEVDLLSVVAYIKPTFLIGCSGKAGAFTRDVILTMARGVEKPIIFPLSNPNAYCEAMPQDILDWTQNKGLIATGSPFEDVMVQGERWPISQCNNALAFPGIGLGMQASGAQRLTDDMLWEASLALCEATPCSADYPILLPDMRQIHRVSEKIAYRICKLALQSAEREVSGSDIMNRIRAQYWMPLLAESVARR
jgi:malate dehydrogenase (oxaloacetate-decarboxylating)